ncbi:MAG: hypothetical protein PHX08_06525 [Lachnospiraceae bacterium]|nr:hypothetical protein [Lachnospiraceae bacterium]
MGKNFIGKAELLKFSHNLGIQPPEDEPLIPYNKDFLSSNANDYLLLLGVDIMRDGKSVSLSSLRSFFGINPEKSEPCFYNQDWYLEESFMQMKLKSDWYIIRKNVHENSRSVSPDFLISQYKLPSAIQCAYAFFVSWYCLSECLWQHDFVWCNDKDHNGDRIYVGKYYDVDMINKNGFSIHRHLSLRDCYAATNVL